MIIKAQLILKNFQLQISRMAAKKSQILIRTAKFKKMQKIWLKKTIYWKTLD